MSEYDFLRHSLPDTKKDRLEIRGEIEESCATELIRALSSEYNVDSVDKEGGLTIVLRGVSPFKVAKKIIEATPGCFVLKIKPDGLELKEIECPPCREGEATPLDKNTYLLSNGKFIVVDSKDKIRVYACRIIPSK